MELIAATRVVKAMTRANAAAHTHKNERVIEDLAAGGVGIDDPLLRSSETVSSIEFVVITSDRGLAGAYNSSAIRAAEKEIWHQTEGKEYKLVLVGKKAGHFRFSKLPNRSTFSGMTDTHMKMQETLLQQ